MRIVVTIARILLGLAILWFVVAWPLRGYFAPLFARKVPLESR
jgi:hypothetical protein